MVADRIKHVVTLVPFFVVILVASQPTETKGRICEYRFLKFRSYILLPVLVVASREILFWRPFHGNRA
jgi:hypothetical protein